MLSAACFSKVMTTDSPFQRMRTIRGAGVSLDQPHTMVAEGDNLSSQWALMQDFANEVESIGYEYRPLSQNSNSFAGAALQRAGLYGPGTRFPEKFDSQLAFDPISGETRSFRIPGFKKPLVNPINTATPMPFPLNEQATPGPQGSFSDRFRIWGSTPAGIAPQNRPGSFENRFGNWGTVPAGRFGDTDSPVLRALEKHQRSAAPDTPSSTALQWPPSATPIFPRDQPAFVAQIDSAPRPVSYPRLRRVGPDGKPLHLDQPMPPPEHAPAPGMFSGKSIPESRLPPSVWGLPDNSESSGKVDLVNLLVGSTFRNPTLPAQSPDAGWPERSLRRRIAGRRV